jgi:glycerol-3-phosphate dehydrogenase subunit C
MQHQELRLRLDWSGYDSYGQGDAYAALPAHGGGFGKAAAVCIGSRQCQKASGQAGDKGVMCPSFRVTRNDLHSTRGRAAILRDALSGTLGEQPFADGTLDAALDLCVACKGCKRECPNGIDMAAPRAETLAQRWAARPVP